MLEDCRTIENRLGRARWQPTSCKYLLVNWRLQIPKQNRSRLDANKFAYQKDWQNNFLSRQTPRWRFAAIIFFYGFAQLRTHDWRRLTWVYWSLLALKLYCIIFYTFIAVCMLYECECQNWHRKSQKLCCVSVPHMHCAAVQVCPTSSIPWTDGLKNWVISDSNHCLVFERSVLDEL